MEPHAPIGEDDLPDGLPHIDGDEAGDGAATERAPDDDADDERSESVGLDDGGFLEDEAPVDALDEGTTGLDGWETAESEPHELDPSIEPPDDASWLGQAALGAEEDDLATDGPDGEGGPSGVDGGEEGFEDDAGSEVETRPAFGPGGGEHDADADGPAADAFELEGAADREDAYAALALEPGGGPLALDVAPASLAVLACTPHGVAALALEPDGSTRALVEEAGRLVSVGHAPGAPRALVGHPRLGLVVATSAGTGFVGGTLAPVRLRALTRLGDGLLGLDEEGRLLLGARPAALAPRHGHPQRARALGQAPGGAAAVVDEAGAVLLLDAAGDVHVLGRVPPRDAIAVAAAGRLAAVRFSTGSAWASLEPDDGFEPEPALFSASEIVAGLGVEPTLVALAHGRIVRVAGVGRIEALAAPGARAIALGDDGALVVLDARGLTVLRLARQGDGGDAPG